MLTLVLRLLAILAIASTIAAVPSRGHATPFTDFPVYTLETTFAGATASGGSYEVHVLQDVTLWSNSGAEPAFFEEWRNYDARSNGFDLAARIRATVDGVTTEDQLSTSPGSSYVFWIGRNDWDDPVQNPNAPGWDTVDLEVLASVIEVEWEAFDDVSLEPWPDQEPLYGQHPPPTVLPALVFWSSRSSQDNTSPPWFRLSIGGVDQVVEYPTSFTYQVTGYRFLPEPGSGLLVFAGLVPLAGLARSRSRRRGRGGA